MTTLQENASLNIGIVNHWPETKTAESEFIKRFQGVLKNKGYNCSIIDNNGCLISDNHKIESLNCTSDLDLAIVFDPQMIEGIFKTNIYTPLWIPPGFMDAKLYRNWFIGLNNCVDFIGGFESPLMVENTNNTLALSGQNISGKLPDFYPSPLESYAIEPQKTLKTPKLFYVGVNCERIKHSDGKIHTQAGRFHKLFSILDKTNYMRFFGPEEFGGIKSWAGFNSYCGEIPFDGKSILSKANELGVSLVLLSKVHYHYSIPTSRLFEALASGSIIISDNNKFVVDNLSDCVLIIDTTKSEEEVAKQIDEKMQWIKDNPKDAYNLAKKSYKRFKKDFALERSIDQLVEFHKSKKDKIISKTQIDVLSICTDNNKNSIANIIEQINKQRYGNINFIFACRKDFVSYVKKEFDRLLDIKYKIIPTNNDNKESAFLQMSSYIKGEYFCILDTDCDISAKHIDSLVQVSSSNSENIVSYSGNNLYYESYNSKPVVSNKPFKIEEILSFAKNDGDETFNFLKLRLVKSLFLFHKSILNEVETGDIKSINGYEHLYLLILSILKNGEYSIKFSFRNTCSNLIFKDNIIGNDDTKAFGKIGIDFFNIFVKYRQFEKYLPYDDLNDIYNFALNNTKIINGENCLFGKDVDITKRMYQAEFQHMKKGADYKIQFNIKIPKNYKKQFVLLQIDNSETLLVSKPRKIGQKSLVKFILSNDLISANPIKLKIYLIERNFINKIKMFGISSLSSKRKANIKLLKIEKFLIKTEVEDMSFTVSDFNITI